MLNLTITGTLQFEPDNPPRPPGKYVYQRVRAGLGNVQGAPNAALQLRAHVIPADPQTPAQLARRAAFAAAVATWHATLGVDREQWRALATARKISLFNAAISALTTGAIPPTGTA